MLTDHNLLMVAHLALFGVFCGCVTMIGLLFMFEVIRKRKHDMEGRDADS